MSQPRHQCAQNTPASPPHSPPLPTRASPTPTLSDMCTGTTGARDTRCCTSSTSGPCGRTSGKRTPRACATATLTTASRPHVSHSTRMVRRPHTPAPRHLPAYKVPIVQFRACGCHP
ncbi:hypothetical protein K438DRAFT_1831908 [Mycena galopus ATCC 62051]|nr:hypothetical protein K438DRAFT_1831908 [Mycena galopus ATCC 62051]